MSNDGHIHEELSLDLFELENDFRNRKYYVKNERK